jgi:hypothetical protein
MKIISRLVFIIIISFTYWAQASSQKECPQTAASTNVFQFELDNLYDLYFHGYAASCELKCFNKHECQQACQHQMAIAKTTQEIKNRYGKEFLNCSIIKGRLAAH